MTSITGKLFGLLFTQITKPLVAVLSKSAKNSPKFRTTVVQIGRIPHEFIDAIQRKLVISPKKMKPPTYDANMLMQEKPPTDDEAFEIGAQFIAEILVYLTSAAYLVYEFRHIAKKDHNHDNAITEIRKGLATQTDEVVRVDREIGKIDTKLQDTIKITNKNSNQLDQMIKNNDEPTPVLIPKPEIPPPGILQSIGWDSKNTSTISRTSK